LFQLLSEVIFYKTLIRRWDSERELSWATQVGNNRGMEKYWTALY